MVSDSTSPSNFLAIFPEIDKELDVTFKSVMSRAVKSGFRHSKERVIIAEVFFNKKPDLAEDDQRELIALIKDAGDLKELKGHLRNWESSSTGGPPSLWARITSLLGSKEWTSECVDEAAHESKGMQDWAFLATLQGKVSKEPLLEQLAQDVVTEAHTHFQDVMRQCLPRLYSRARDIKQNRVYHQVEAEANNQDRKRSASLRSDWIDGIKLAQVDSGCVFMLSTGTSDIT